MGIRTTISRLAARFIVVSAALLLFGSTSAQVAPFGRQLRGTRHVVQGGMIVKPDSAAIRRADSIRITLLADSLRQLPTETLHKTTDSVRMLLPDTLRKRIFVISADSLAKQKVAADSIKRAEKQLLRQKKRENRKPILSDSMAMRKVCIAAALLPGYGQIYNKQYWKLPILYGTMGASLGLCLWANSKFTPLKRQFNAITDQSLQRTPELNALQRQMIKYNTMKQVFMFSTIASHLYFIGDAAMCYATNDVSRVTRATTLSMVCPGAGQIYNKSYWRAPIVIGGFAATIYCIDWNNRGYQRFKKAYRLRADYDANPEAYPSGSLDEFGGRYASSFLKNLRNSYRRNRDLCIILTAGIYILQIVDAHADAHMRDFDISRDLHDKDNKVKVKLEPTVNYAYGRGGIGGAALGMNLNLTF